MIRWLLAQLSPGLPFTLFMWTVALWDFPVGPVLLYHIARRH